MAPLSVAFLSPLEDPLSAGPGVPGRPILEVVELELAVSFSLTSFSPPHRAVLSLGQT